MEELLPVWYLNSPKAAVSILDGTYDSVMLLFFPSVFPLSSFLLFLSKEKTQDPEECADVLSSLTLLPRLNLTDPTHTRTHTDAGICHCACILMPSSCFHGDQSKQQAGNMEMCPAAQFTLFLILCYTRERSHQFLALSVFLLPSTNGRPASVSGLQ